MKYTAQLTLTQNGEPGALKGEELDTELESLLQGCEPDGWEVSSVKLTRDAAAKSLSSESRADILRIFDALVDEIPDKTLTPSKMNPTITKAELVAHWRETILPKLLGKL